MKRAAFLSLLLLSFAVASPVSTFASGAPSVQSITVTGYQFAVTGSNWPSDARLTFTLMLGAKTYGLELRTTGYGTFEVAAKTVDFSHGFRFWARDFLGDQADSPIGDPNPRSKPHTSPLVVRSGTLIRPKITTIIGMSHGSVTVIHRGGALYLWEPGKDSPKFMPAAPQTYLSIIGTGRAPHPGCAKSECKPGFWWKWIGVKRGDTDIPLSPWCNGNPCPEEYVIAIPLRIT